MNLRTISPSKLPPINSTQKNAVINTEINLD